MGVELLGPQAAGQIGIGPTPLRVKGRLVFLSFVSPAPHLCLAEQVEGGCSTIMCMSC